MSEKELIVKDDIPAIADDELIAIAEVAEKRVAAVKKIITMALKVTSENDWVDQNGKPYLQGNGAEAVANLFGVSWKFIDKPKKVDEGEGHFRYECALEVSFKGRSIEVMGARSTKDTFFSTRYRTNQETKKREPYQLPPSEIDASDVMKSSITNAIGNGVTRILGIRNATWEMLKEAGLNVDKIREKAITYQKAPEGEKDLREEIRRMILEMANGDNEKAKAKLSELTFYKDKSKQYVKDLTDAQVPVIYGKVKEAFEKWSVEQKEKPTEQPQPEQKVGFEDYKTALQNAPSLIELDAIYQEIIREVKGENYTILTRERDKRATILKGNLV